MDKSKDVIDVHFLLQSSITNWGKLLIATGGSLKPAKFFFHLDDPTRIHALHKYVEQAKDKTSVETVRAKQ